MGLIIKAATDLRVALARPGAKENRQGMAEYGLILALVAEVVVGAVTILGTNVQTTLTNIAGSL